MRATLTVLLSLLLLAATAQAHTKRLTVDTVTRWETPQSYGPHAAVGIRVYVNSHLARVAYRPGWGLGYAARGVVIEARTARRGGPIRFRIANARERAARVRIVWRRYEP